MRKLASIQLVNEVEPIANADAIEKLHVLGWWVVAKKGDFRPGDRVVYIEIDSLLPERPEFEFLRASSYRPAVMEDGVQIQPAGFRIKTVRLRGQVSQGICLPLSVLPPEAPTAEGDDVTEVMDIRKYEPPLPVGMGGKVKGGFPGFLAKTDEMRVQVLLPVLERNRGKTFYVTEKLDGTSFTAFLRDGTFGVCTRNLWMDERDETNIHIRVAKKLKLEEKLQAIQAKHGFQPAIQGEVIGPAIQGNKYKLASADLYVFNVYDIGASRLVEHRRMLDILEEIGLKGVPQLGTTVLDHSVDQLIELSVGPSQLNAKTEREGIVLRPLTEEYDSDIGGRLSFKAINPKFLLKYDE